MTAPAKTTRRRPNRGPKPAKPWPDFPLYAHNGGVWAKAIRGRVHYFGPWHDPHGALERYLAVRDHLHGGLDVPPDVDGVTLDELVNRWLDSLLARKASAEITERHFQDCRRDGKRVLDALGRPRPVASLRPADFATLRGAIAEGRAVETVHSIMTRVRSMFTWGVVNGLLERRPRYGTEFRRPSASRRRRARRRGGRRDLPAEAIRTLLDAAGGHVKLRAMILLGVNAALGNSDCAALRTDHLDLRAGVLDFPRPKTGVGRRAALWPETTDALASVLELRLRAGEPEGELRDRVFVTDRRQAYVRQVGSTSHDAIGGQFARLLRDSGLHRPGLGFYALRRTFQTVADATRDFPAIDLVMGHAAADVPGATYAVEMSARYREHIADDRLRAVADHVRRWLRADTEREARR